MSCLRKADGTAISCTTAYQKWTGQPIHLAGSKNPLPLGMGSVKDKLSEGDLEYEENGEDGYDERE